METVAVITGRRRNWQFANGVFYVEEAFMPQWIMIWVNTARFGRPGIARRAVRDVQKYCRSLDLLRMFVTNYGLTVIPYGDQYVLIRIN
jgi:hypothetical protein